MVGASTIEAAATFSVSVKNYARFVVFDTIVNSDGD
jgi:hypothetical protein